MNGEIAQFVALTCHGNAFLEAKSIPEFFPANSTCTFCDRVTFVEMRRSFLWKPKEVEIAKNPNEWFSYLKRRGARGIQLLRHAQDAPQIPDRMSAGFVGGGGAWTMEVSFANEQVESWRARWTLWNQEAAERRIWRVTYGPLARSRRQPFEYQNLEVVKKRLHEALREIHAFSLAHKCGGFTDCFARAISSMTTGVRHGYHKDLAPPDLLSPEAAGILDAAQNAWVFGGMGSWNDMSFDGDDGNEYARVSEELFQAVTGAIGAATSTGFDAARFKRASK